MKLRRREFLTAAALLAAGCGRLRTDAPFDGIVSRDAQDRASGIPTHASLGAALAAAPAAGKRPWRIRIAAGRWHEKIVVDKPYIELVGDDRTQCILSFDAAAGQQRPDGKLWGTAGCASIIVRSSDFCARRLTIENTFDYVGEISRSTPTLPPIGSNGAQAVALMLDRGAERSRFDDVDIHGHQDTLFVDAGRSRFRRCTIGGSVDFIFGAGRCLIEDSEVISRFRPGKERQGFVIAPSTLQAQEFGIVLRACRLSREKEVAASSVALGRPWRHARTFADGQYGDPDISSQGAFLDCWMDEHIDALGWEAMRFPTRDGTRVPYDPMDARLFEYHSRGPGARASATRRILTDAQADRYATANVLADWS
ncbi:MAG: pectinesterase family protein [Rudaea sp.]